MGCGCENTQGFKQKLSLAKERTNTTGEIHVVFVMKAVGQVFVCKETDLTDEMGICCYFLPDGTEVHYKVKKELSEVDGPKENKIEEQKGLTNDDSELNKKFKK